MINLKKYKSIISEENKTINVFIEISAGDINKYEYNEETECIELDRIMQTSMSYPANYGFIVNTLAKDGDPLDAFVISSKPILPGVLVKAKVIGVINMEDEAGKDEKIICVLDEKLDLKYKDICCYTNLPEIEIEKILHFLKYYKDLEKGKWVKISEMEKKENAMELIKKSLI
jgi:inorganic pyrophosphatase